MEELFNAIQRRIAENMPELSLVDEDYGQLEAIQTQEDTYPVTFPCLLISMPEVEWENLGGGMQKGRCIVTTRLAMDCYDDSHYGSTTENKAAERQRMATDVHRLLQAWRCGSGILCGLNRTKSLSYSRAGGIKVYEATYEVIVKD